MFCLDRIHMASDIEEHFTYPGTFVKKVINTLWNIHLVLPPIQKYFVEYILCIIFLC
jgi:hypothetical protein